MLRPPPPPDPSTLDPDDRVAYDAIVERCVGKFGTLTPYHGAVANSPRFGAALNDLGRIARTAGDRPGSYSHADREFVDQVLSADWGTNAVLGVHVPDALAAGVRAEAIRAVRDGREDELTDDERLLARYIRAVTTGALTDELWNAMVDRLGVRGAVDYTIFIAFLQMTIRLWQAFGLDGPSDAEVDALIEAGAPSHEEFRRRIG